MFFKIYMKNIEDEIFINGLFIGKSYYLTKNGTEKRVILVSTDGLSRALEEDNVRIEIKYRRCDNKTLINIEKFIWEYVNSKNTNLYFEYLELIKNYPELEEVINPKRE